MKSVDRIIPARFTRRAREVFSPLLVRSNHSAKEKTVCFCTLAIHEPYRRRARLLCADAPDAPWIVLTDKPDQFADMNVRAIQHEPTGPMAVDYLKGLLNNEPGQGTAAYHDKRFALMTALKDFDTAIFIDADSRISGLPKLQSFRPGLAVLPLLLYSIDDHLKLWGSWRRDVFEDLALELTGNLEVLKSARWCSEPLMAVTKDGRESAFFEAWSIGADFFQSRGVYSGEGGVIGLAAAYAGWTIDYHSLRKLGQCIQHECGGPTSDD